MSDIPQEPKKSAADVAYTVVKAAVSAVPVAGGSAAELLGLIFGPPLERRREQWLEQLAHAIKEVNDKVADLTPEKLAEDEVFITTALHATEIAVRTHQQEKIEALQNAVVNAALQSAPDETMQHIFLNYVDSLTPSHIQMLASINRRERVHPYELSDIVILPSEVKKQLGAVFCQIMSDLEQRGLIIKGEALRAAPHRIVSIEDQPDTTALGKLFLEFISRKSPNTTNEYL